jgi:GH18 family chitinase
MYLNLGALCSGCSYYYYSPTGVQPWEIPGNQVSHVLYSFANVWKDGTVTLQNPVVAGLTDNVIQATAKEFGQLDSGKCNCNGNCLKGELYQLHLLKMRYPHLKTLLSVGGWVWSDNFSDVFASQQARARFISTTTDLMEQFGFDGYDIGM